MEKNAGADITVVQLVRIRQLYLKERATNTASSIVERVVAVLGQNLPDDKRSPTTEHLVLCSVGQKAIRVSYSDPLTRIVVAGEPGRGKSTTCSNLYSCYTETQYPYFTTSVGQDSFTKGMWIGSEPLRHKGMEMMVIDLEGLVQTQICHHQTLAAFLFADFFCYMSSGDRIEDNVRKIIEAVIDLAQLHALQFNWPAIVFLMTNCEHEQDAFFDEKANVISHDQFRDAFCRKHPKIASAIGPGKLFFRVLSRPEKRISGPCFFKSYRNHNSQYYHDMKNLLDFFCENKVDQNVEEGIDNQTAFLGRVLTCLNAGTVSSICDVQRAWIESHLTSFAQNYAAMLTTETLAVIGSLPCASLQPGLACVHEKYTTLVERFNLAIHKEAKAKKCILNDEHAVSAIVASVARLVPSEDTFKSAFVHQVNAAKEHQERIRKAKKQVEEVEKERQRLQDEQLRLARQQARQQLITQALNKKRKVRVNGCLVCSSCKRQHEDGVCHYRCTNGEDGIYYWIDTKEKICNLCQKTSKFKGIACYSCGSNMKIKNLY